MDERRRITLSFIRNYIGFNVVASIGAIAFLVHGLWGVSLAMGVLVFHSTYLLSKDIIKLRRGDKSD